MMKVIGRCSEWAERIGIVLATGSGFIMLFALLVGVTTRWLPFMTSAIWSEEIARMCMLWLTANGASVAYKRADLVRFNLLVDLFSKKVRYLLELVSYVCVGIVLGVLLKYGYEMLLLKMRVRAAATRISYFWWALGLYIGFVLMAVHTVWFAAGHVKDWKKVMKGGGA
ncbi:MAG: TRAP transporter small permease subunit [Lachnospiraceae bacterium]|nr:TRAP transporter small permease subunit [Lachnospiraceae bacterium]